MQSRRSEVSSSSYSPPLNYEPHDLLVVDIPLECMVVFCLGYKVWVYIVEGCSGQGHNTLKTRMWKENPQNGLPNSMPRKMFSEDPFCTFRYGLGFRLIPMAVHVPNDSILRASINDCNPVLRGSI